MSSFLSPSLAAADALAAAVGSPGKRSFCPGSKPHASEGGPPGWPTPADIFAKPARCAIGPFTVCTGRNSSTPSRYPAAGPATTGSSRSEIHRSDSARPAAPTDAARSATPRAAPARPAAMSASVNRGLYGLLNGSAGARLSLSHSCTSCRRPTSRIQSLCSVRLTSAQCTTTPSTPSSSSDSLSESPPPPSMPSVPASSPVRRWRRRFFGRHRRRAPRRERPRASSTRGSPWPRCGTPAASGRAPR